MTGSKNSGRERRRYPRIFLQGTEGFKTLVGAQVAWPAGAKTDVLDLSYTGAALVQGSGSSFDREQACSLKFHFAGQDPVAVETKIIRADGRLAAVQIDKLEPSARLAFETFLNDNLLGLNLRSVNSSFFNQGQDFDQWLHGPKDTNVFIWGQKEAVEKAVVEIDHQILVWNKGKLTQGKSRSDLLSAIEDYYSPVLYESVRAGLNVDQQLLSRVIKILSQVQAPTPSVKQLLVRLGENVKA
jgi:hypothetical protein